MLLSYYEGRAAATFPYNQQTTSTLEAPDFLQAIEIQHPGTALVSKVEADSAGCLSLHGALPSIPEILRRNAPNSHEATGQPSRMDQERPQGIIGNPLRQWSANCSCHRCAPSLCVPQQPKIKEYVPVEEPSNSIKPP